MEMNVDGHSLGAVSINGGDCCCCRQVASEASSRLPLVDFGRIQWTQRVTFALAPNSSLLSLPTHSSTSILLPRKKGRTSRTAKTLRPIFKCASSLCHSTPLADDDNWWLLVQRVDFAQSRLIRLMQGWKKLYSDAFSLTFCSDTEWTLPVSKLLYVRTRGPLNALEPLNTRSCGLKPRHVPSK